MFCCLVSIPSCSFFSQHRLGIFIRIGDTTCTGCSIYAFIVGRDEYIEGYGRQAIFIRKNLDKTLDGILANSPIIVQGDHGSGSRMDFYNLDDTDIGERMLIFNAYYLPDGGNGQLYDGIIPVNTFRIIHNKYFGLNLDPLEDKNYYSPIDEPYKLTDVRSS